MTTRIASLLAVTLLCAAAGVAAAAGPQGDAPAATPLHVTYYYLPG